MDNSNKTRILAQVYSSVDDMLKAMEDARIAADAISVPWQEALAPGDYFVRSARDIPIFCQILDPAAVGPDASEEEIEAAAASADMYAQPHMKMFRFCRAYSKYCPQGELGDIHVSTAIQKITKDVFDKAQEANWSPGLNLRKRPL